MGQQWGERHRNAGLGTHGRGQRRAGKNIHFLETTGVLGVVFAAIFFYAHQPKLAWISIGVIILCCIIHPSVLDKLSYHANHAATARILRGNDPSLSIQESEKLARRHRANGGG